MRVDSRYRYLYKPLVFILGLAPLGWLLAGAFGWYGADLGPDPVDELTHATGKTAINFLWLTLLVTPVRELAKLPHLLRLRRMLGLFAFCYALLHFAVYLVIDRALDMPSILTDIGKRPYVTVGFTALLLLLPLAITSTNGMMRRLGRRWQRLHRLIYPIAALAAVHFYWQVKRDVREPLIYALILAALFAYRFLKRRGVTSRFGSATAPERI